MIDEKLAIVTVHDINPSHSEKILKTLEDLNKLKIKYNLSIVPYYSKKYHLKDYSEFCDQITSLMRSGNIELTLHGLYHQVDGKIEDFDTESKEDEKQEIEQGLDIFSTVGFVRPLTFIPPGWHLSRQAIDALKELKFSISESNTEIEFIQKGKKYILHPVLNWDQQGDKEKNKPALKENKEIFYNRLFNVNGNTYGLIRLAIHPPYDPDEALSDQIEMIEYIRDKERYKFLKYSDLLSLEDASS